MRSIRILFIVAFVSISLLTKAQEEDAKWTSGRPDGHAPIGVMGDHTHSKGGFMLSYRYMDMSMEESRTDSDEISTATILQTYMVVPISMDMKMHMLGGMYAVSDKLTLMAMFNYQKRSMDHVTRMGVEFTTESSGIGDIKLSALYNLFNKNRSTLHLNAGFSLPTGSVTDTGTTPMGPGQKLPYPMQIGSGTLDFLPGITFQKQADNVSWGAQLMGNIRLEENGEEYSLGNQVQITSWLQYKLSDWISVSVRLAGKTTGEISGADPELNPMMVQTADPTNYGGDVLDGTFGLNLYIRDGFLKGHRLGVEYKLPFYQNLNGSQLSTKRNLTLVWQYAF